MGHPRRPGDRPALGIVDSAPVSQILVLVDEADRPVGTGEKLEVHRRGLLHRAFSVVVHRPGPRGVELLLQQRAASKYHSPGLWANACCGHPSPDLEVGPAARRRLAEEMGIDIPLDPLFVFRYRAELAGAMVEHEIDHVLAGEFAGEFAGDPRPDPREVADWRWVTLEALDRELRAAPGRFAAWFPLLLPGVTRHLSGT